MNLHSVTLPKPRIMPTTEAGLNSAGETKECRDTAGVLGPESK